jgi:hypothetical protein
MEIEKEYFDCPRDCHDRDMCNDDYLTCPYTEEERDVEGITGGSEENARAKLYDILEEEGEENGD